MTISQDASAPLIVVTLATGAQGGSVIKALSESDRPYRIRGLTRDTTKPASQALTKKGVEVVAIDVKPDNKQEVQKVFQGAKYAFLVTVSAVQTSKANVSSRYIQRVYDSSNALDAIQEIAEGKMYIDAAKAAEAELTIWSGLEDMAVHSGGKYLNVDHFDAKVSTKRHALRISTVIRLTRNVSNRQIGGSYQVCQRDWASVRDGTYVVANPAAPESVVPLIDTANDYGLFVRKAIETPGAPEICGYGEVISNAEIVKQLSEITGKKVTYVQVTDEQYMASLTTSGFSELAAREFSGVFNSIAEFGYFGKADTKPSLEGLVRLPRTWAEFVKATDWSAVLN
ncbi:hypothetical protein FRB93_006927 [Tulasnella sp. JGI-2019a]|nr:hypothetical protein FRB93_006927 [Tulasnella sp. JGI-2019a]